MAVGCANSGFWAVEWESMNKLHRKTLVGLLILMAMLASCVFLPAGSLHYWQAWLFLCAYLVPMLGLMAYLVKQDPKLLERRIDAKESSRTQRIILALLRVSFVAVLAVSAFDHRFGWSRVPVSLTLLGDFLIVTGIFTIFLVFRENSFASSTIRIDPEQTVVSTGPYARVRHPMYSGGLLMILGMPLALGSWWGLLAFVPVVVVIVWRLLEEEKFLAEKLPGYAEYRSRVRFRLVPLLW